MTVEDDGGNGGEGDDLLDGEEDLSASASSDLSTADVGDEFEFDGSDSTGEIDSFEWSFDDGNAETGEIVTHSFEEEGTYTVELEVSRNSETDTGSVSVEVEEGDGSVSAAGGVGPDVLGVPVWLILVLLSFVGLQIYWW